MPAFDVMKRYLIVNADDFGLSPGVNRGVIECAEKGILTSASLMVRWPAAAEAAEYARKNPAISVGLHVDLGEWVCRNGEWELLYKVVDTENAKAVAEEIHRQLEEFKRLVGRNPSHLDSHQHIHRTEPSRSVMLKLAAEMNIPLRGATPRLSYCGDFYGQGADGESYPELLTVENFKKILTSLEAAITEIGCHPGYGDDLESPYCKERNQEIRVLCHPDTRANIESSGFELINFVELTSRKVT